MIDYKHFGSICADSTTYQNTYEILDLNNNHSDIIQLFDMGSASIGYIKNNPRKTIKVSIYPTNNMFIFSAKCNGIQVWKQTPLNDVESLAWAYIDLLSDLSQNLVIYNKTLPTNHPRKFTL